MRIAIIGAAGRMGQEVARAAAARPDEFTIAGALIRPGSPFIGQSLAALAPEIAALPGAAKAPLTDRLAEACAHAEALIDFSAPDLSLAAADYAAKGGKIHIIGTTGFTPPQIERLKACGQKTIIVQSGNMSLGVNLLAALAEQAARALPANFDIEILEMHHRNKLDAPSGTALLLGEAAAKGRAIELPKHSIMDRGSHKGRREAGSIGFASLRGGTVVGEHSVIFAGPGERLTLAHSAEDRGIFANGALAAAQWAKGRPHGFYSMRDVLGLGG